MSRYIDADALLKNLPEDLPYKASVKRVLTQAPTADVVEVKRGKWKKVYEIYPMYVCTSCNHLYNNKEYRYCPNCGSKNGRKRRAKE